MCGTNIDHHVKRKHTEEGFKERRPERDEKQRCFREPDEVKESYGERSSGRMHTDRFQMIVSKKGDTTGLFEALVTPCGRIHT